MDFPPNEYRLSRLRRTLYSPDAHCAGQDIAPTHPPYVHSIYFKWLKGKHEVIDSISLRSMLPTQRVAACMERRVMVNSINACQRNWYNEELNNTFFSNLIYYKTPKNLMHVILFYCLKMFSIIMHVQCIFNLFQNMTFIKWLMKIYSKHWQISIHVLSVYS